MRSFRMRVVRFVALFALSCTVAAPAQSVRGRTTAPVSGITVTGRATAQSLPERARVTVVIPPPAPNAGGVAPEDAADAVRDALKAAGIADARVVYPVGTLVNIRFAGIQVVGNVAHPTREGLEATARAALKALPDRIVPAIGNAQIQLALFSSHCGPDEERAERAAFDDAKRRAERIAAAAGVRLGSVEAVDAQQTSVPGSCDAPLDASDSFTVSGGFSSLYGPLAIQITASEIVTFAIAGS